MNVIRKARLWLLVLPLSAIAAGCSGGALSNIAAPDSGMSKVSASTTQVVRALPRWLGGRAERSFRGVLAPRSTGKGIYVSSIGWTVILGFSMAGKGPRCDVFTGGSEGVNDIFADPKGNLIVPLGSPRTVNVYHGPNMCGPKAGSFSDPYGQPSDAASLNALKGTIAVANIVGSGSGAGNIAICTLKSGCTKELTNPNIIGYVGAVAMARNGDCWATSDGVYSYYISPPTMTYWKGCSGAGEAVTGYKNTAYGSISIDAHGYLVSLDLGSAYGSSQLWVYKGCNPDCTLVGGPFALHGRGVFGGLNANSNEYGMTNYEEGSYPYTLTDIYQYSPTGVTYKFSFQNQEGGADPEGFAFSPSPNR